MRSFALVAPLPSKGTRDSISASKNALERIDRTDRCYISAHIGVSATLFSSLNLALPPALRVRGRCITFRLISACRQRYSRFSALHCHPLSSVPRYIHDQMTLGPVAQRAVGRLCLRLGRAKPVVLGLCACMKPQLVRHCGRDSRDSGMLFICRYSLPFRKQWKLLRVVTSDLKHPLIHIELKKLL
jgi:hypothetical protein